jgi:hypothetical protein
VTRKVREFLETISTASPVLINEQFRLHVSVVAPETAERILDRFQNQGFIETKLVVTNVMTKPMNPLFVHRPDEIFGKEEASHLSSLGSERLAKSERKEVLLIWPTEKAFLIFGGAARKKGNPAALAHDIHLSWIHLANRHRGAWLHEPEPPTGRVKGEKIPDAAILDGKGFPKVFLESVGAYTIQRLKDLCSFSDGAEVPIEFW